MNNFKLFFDCLRKATGVAILLLGTQAAQAQIVNGNFSAGLTGWTVRGDAVASVISSAGTLTLTTAAKVDGDAAFNLSGNPALDVAVLETAASVAPYAFDLVAGLPTGAATEGTVVQQSFVAAAGQTLSFTWFFSTPETTLRDHAFVVLNGQVTTLATGTNTGNALNTFSRTFTQSGPVLLSFGVVDTDDYDVVSKLNIRNVQITAVPEPAAWLLMLAGAGVIFQRRRQV
jgi:hypothetical protein